MSMLPSKVMPYLLRLAAPLMDSSIVQTSIIKGKATLINQEFPHLGTESLKPVLQINLLNCKFFGSTKAPAFQTFNHSAARQRSIVIG